MMFKDFLADRMPIKSKAGYVEFGYGQVEPNHLSAQRTGQIYAQLPANKNIEVLEQGQFVKYDYAANGNGIGEVNFTGEGEWMLVLNEVKLYDDAWRESYKDFSLMPDNRGDITPRLFKTDIGDIFTTNCLVLAGAKGEEVDMGEIALNDKLSPNANGYLSKDGDGSMEWKVVKVYTMPDGQEGVKLQRVK